MAASCGPGARSLFLTLLVAGCQVPTVSPPATRGGRPALPRVTATSQVISTGSGGTTLSQSSPSAPVDAFADLDSLLAAPTGPTQVNQVGPMIQQSGPGGTQQTIQASPNPATNLSGFLGDLFNRVGVGQSSQQGMMMGSGNQQSIIQSSQMGPGSQQSMSSSSYGGMQQQVVSNGDGTVSVLRSGPAGTGVWRSETQTYRQGDGQQPIRSVTSTVTRDTNCQETTRTRTITTRPDGSSRESLNVFREDVCTGESLGEVRGQIQVVNGERRLVGSIVRPDGSVQGFSRPLP
jgi:hypothetical protein